MFLQNNTVIIHCFNIKYSQYIQNSQDMHNDHKVPTGLSKTLCVYSSFLPRVLNLCLIVDINDNLRNRVD